MWIKPYPQPNKPEKKNQWLQSLEHMATLYRYTEVSFGIIAYKQEIENRPIEFKA
jgi:hypothetical protein